jgi:putative salt-induced outer membrane protein YdiY
MKLSNINNKNDLTSLLITMSKLKHIMKIMRHNFQLKSIDPSKHWQFTTDHHNSKISFEQYEKNTNNILFEIMKNKTLSSQIHDDDYYTITQDELLNINIDSNMKKTKELAQLTKKNKYNIVGYEYINGHYYSFVNKHYNGMFVDHVLCANSKHDITNHHLRNMENHIKDFDFILECDELNDATPITKIFKSNECHIYHKNNYDVLINKIKNEIMDNYKHQFA